MIRLFQQRGIVESQRHEHIFVVTIHGDNQRGIQRHHIFIRLRRTLKRNTADTERRSHRAIICLARLQEFLELFPRLSARNEEWFAVWADHLDDVLGSRFDSAGW